jgi:hypothetical protein
VKISTNNNFSWAMCGGSGGAGDSRNWVKRQLLSSVLTNGRSLDGSLAKRQLLSHVLMTDDFQGVRERGRREVHHGRGRLLFPKKIGERGRVNMYSHGWLLLTDGEGIGVGCPCLAPPERERHHDRGRLPLWGEA